MKNLLLLIFFFSLFRSSHSQSGYLFCGLDGNVDMAKVSTIGYGMQLQLPIKQSDWHLNWQMSLGGSLEGDLYLRANALTLLYKSSDYWEYTPDEDHQFGDRFFNFLFSAILPLLCPNGITRIMPPIHDKLKVGFYFNPFIADYWYSRNKIRSWTYEGGVKLFFNKKNPGTGYFTLGGARIHNTESYLDSDYRNGWFVTFSLGIAVKTKPDEKIKE